MATLLMALKVVTTVMSLLVMDVHHLAKSKTDGRVKVETFGPQARASMRSAEMAFSPGAKSATMAMT
jgi:hypothetical protein